MAYGSTQMPYNYAKNAGAPLLDNVNPEQVGGGATPNVAGQANQPPKSAVQPNLGGPQPSAPPQTFAQMQAAGYARPPIPAPTQAPNAVPAQPSAPSYVPGTTGGGSPGAVGTGWLPGTNQGGGSGIVDLGGGMAAPTNNSGQGALSILPTPQGVSLNAAGYPIHTDTGLPWTGQDQMGLLGSMMSGGQPVSAGARGPSGGPSFSTNAGQMALAPSGGNVQLPFGAGSVDPTTGQVTGQQGNVITPGAAMPPTTTPQGYDILGALTGGAQGSGQGGALQGATNQAALNQLNNPSPYNSDAVKALYGWLGGDIQDQYTQGQRAIGENMARRGLGTSTIHAGALNDLNVGRRSAQESMGQNLAQNYAQTLGQYQANAIGQGNQVGSQNQQNQQSWLNQLMGYGQQGFNNDLATQGMNEQQQQNYQNYILGLLQYGQGG